MRLAFSFFIYEVIIMPMGYGPFSNNPRYGGYSHPQSRYANGYGGRNGGYPRQNYGQRPPMMGGYWPGNRQQSIPVRPQDPRQNPGDWNEQARQPTQPPPNVFQQPLPDGVTMQPLDENLMKQLQGISIPRQGRQGRNDGRSAQPCPQDPPPMGRRFQFPAPNSIPAAPETIGGSPTAPIQEHYVPDNGFPYEKLEELIQNERNAFEFYNYLSRIAPRKEYSAMLEEICKCCDSREQSLNLLYRGIRGDNYVIEKREVDKTLPFNDGLRLAIMEESKGLRGLSGLYAHIEDNQSLKLLNAQVAGKVSDLMTLGAMR